MDWQEAKVSDLMQGKGGVDEIDLVRLLSYCRIPAAEMNYLLALFRESREKGWLLFPEDRSASPARSSCGR